MSTKKQKAEQEYRQFVKWGIGKESIWGKVKGQALLGDEDFVDGFIDYLRKHKDVVEIPKSPVVRSVSSLNENQTISYLTSFPLTMREGSYFF